MYARLASRFLALEALSTLLAASCAATQSPSAESDAAVQGGGGTGNGTGGSGASGATGAGGTGAGGAPARAASYGVFEQDFSAPTAGATYVNPWEDVSVTMTVTAPSGRSVSVGGFYYGSNTWKARFAADEPGTWKWSATARDKTTSHDSSGSFEAKADGSHGFLRLNPDNKYRFLYEDGTPYYGIGLQNCLPDAGSLGSTSNRWLYTDAGVSTDIDTFLKTTADGGFNMYRWTTDNCSPGLWKTISAAGNAYKETEAKDGDSLVKTLHKYGFSVELTLFNYWVNTPPNFASTTIAADAQKALQRYAKYIIDRYGAYVDIWELVNEGNASAAWYAALVPYMKRYDPYTHPITTSTTYTLDNAALGSGIDLNTAHWYAPVTENVAADWTFGNLNDWKRMGSGMNTVVSETGNCCNVCNYGPTGLRLRNWASVFVEGLLIYWDDARSKTACGGANTNYYIGSEERAYTKILADFMRGFDPSARIAGDLKVTGSGVSGHALAGSKDYAVYLVNGTNHTTPTTAVSVTIAPRAPGTATWISPATGKTLATSDVPAGSQTLSVPDFVTDVALKIQGH